MATLDLGSVMQSMIERAFDPDADAKEALTATFVTKLRGQVLKDVMTILKDPNCPVDARDFIQRGMNLDKR